MSLLHVEIRGRVQGVGFRWYVRERARELGVAGWVKNLASGAVEVAASGPDAAVNQLLAAIRRGPPGAHVAEVIQMAPTAENELSNPFSIVR